MRKPRLLTVLLAALMIFALLPDIAYATEYEPCYHCNSTGYYHCSVCGNAGEYTCTACGGAGGSPCPECGGLGYLICPSCGGDGLMRTADGEVCAEACGNCGGSGKIDCMPCKPSGGTGWCKCNACGGTGKCACCVEECVASRAIGYKCQYCKGTGYMGTGKSFPPSMNDGTHNIPHSGDWIVLNQSTWVTYDNYVKGITSGGSSGGEDAQQPAQGEEPANPPQSVDTPDSPDNPETPDLPGNPEAPDMPGSPETDNPPEDGNSPVEPEGPSRLPENRDYIEIPARDAAGQPNMIIIDASAMPEEERAFYYGIPDEELEMILEDLENIISSAQPGRFGTGLEERLNEIAFANGYGTAAECGIIPLYVDGGQERDFPVQMKLVMEKGVLNRTDIYIYHLAADNTLTCLGPAEVFTYPDGSVETLQFTTKNVTSYFTSYDDSLSLVPPDDRPDSPAPAEEPEADAPQELTEPQDSRDTKLHIPLAVIIAPVVLIAVAVILIIKRKKH